uniref:Pseudouridine-5'-phosphate glycosidase n=2 Tax=Cacopsylla melanoneura TaxID=428564 RepID=A0A8D8RU03_9HEMI
MDVSADLVEMGRQNIMVVSAGVKSILDIGRTLEYLETQGVCVVTFGPTRTFPSFYTAQSPYEAPYHVDTIENAARLLQSHNELNVKSGILLGVPIPKEYQVINGQDLDKIIQTCLAECTKKNITGKYITPYLLDQVAKRTEGKSLQANIGLIKNNVKIGSEILVKWSKLKAQKV